MASASIRLGPSVLDVDRLLLIVTGAHLRSEVGDRPMAYALRERIMRWLVERFGPPETDDDIPPANHPFDPIVCSDVWWLNNDDLRRRPTICIGGPGVNALSAYLADKVPSAFVIENRLLVQVDLDFDDLVACCWGMDHEQTKSAVAAFADKYLDSFLEAAAKASQAES